MANSALNKTTIQYLTNNSGDFIAQGTVVFVNHDNPHSVYTTATPNVAVGILGVVFDSAGIADSAIGAIAIAGYVSKVLLENSANDGDMFCTSGTVGQGNAHSTFQSGDFGQVWDTGTTPPAVLWGYPAGVGSLPRVAVRTDSGSEVGVRRRINFIHGTSITLSAVDDGGDDEVQVTINGAQPYARIVHQLAYGNNGGIASSSDVWITRPLNTVTNDGSSLVTLNSDQITLVAGTYRCLITVPVYGAGNHKARLRNTTSNATLLVGTADISNVLQVSTIRGIFVVAGSQVLEVQDYIHDAAGGTDDLGACASDSNNEDEVYTVVELWKIG